MNVAEKILVLKTESRRLILGLFRPKILALEKARYDLNVEVRDHWKAYTLNVHELVYDGWDPDPSNEKKWFIVFIDDELAIDWVSNVEIGPEAQDCVSLAESVGARRCSHLPREQILEFRRLIGQAIVAAISGSVKQSRELTESAAKFLKDRTVERSRAWTLGAAHVFLIVFSALLMELLFLFSNSLLAPKSGIMAYFVAAEGGLVGAYLSVIGKAGRGEWDAGAGFGVHNLEVITKLIAGITFGAIAFIFTKSVHVPLSLKEISSDNFSIFVLGVAAGFLEKLVPKIISSYASFEEKGKE